MTASRNPGSALYAPESAPLADTAAPYDLPPPAVHGCWYPSADPSGRHVAFICDRAGVPQLWTGPVDGPEAHRLDADPLQRHGARRTGDPTTHHQSSHRTTLSLRDPDISNNERMQR